MRMNDSDVVPTDESGQTQKRDGREAAVRDGAKLACPHQFEVAVPVEAIRWAGDK